MTCNINLLKINFEISNNLGGEKTHLESWLEIRSQAVRLNFECYKTETSTLSLQPRLTHAESNPNSTHFFNLVRISPARSNPSPLSVVPRRRSHAHSPVTPGGRPPASTTGGTVPHSLRLSISLLCSPWVRLPCGLGDGRPSAGVVPHRQPPPSLTLPLSLILL